MEYKAYAVAPGWTLLGVVILALVSGAAFVAFYPFPSPAESSKLSPVLANPSVMTQDDLMELKHFIAERDKQSEEDRRKIIGITNKYINLKKCINHAAKWGLPARPCIDARTEPCSRCPRDFDT